MSVLLMGRMYELRRWNWPRRYDIHTKFHKEWFKYSKFVREDAHRQQSDLISLLLYFQNKESRVKSFTELAGLQVTL
jgi:hypothetical protein